MERTNHEHLQTQTAPTTKESSAGGALQQPMRAVLFHRWPIAHSHNLTVCSSVEDFQRSQPRLGQHAAPASTQCAARMICQSRCFRTESSGSAQESAGLIGGSQVQRLKAEVWHSAGLRVLSILLTEAAVRPSTLACTAPESGVETLLSDH
ncbi:hypothetical protein AAFF_G00440530 [Aldrovandia affinis]|uniref:Uncharacterized protein n=1 Tax=Aldrovandia affinis TaxID=143900 RepID=A0AAD7S766_9TELE|nr:hypothetical protein AAFF_G00440530 [Aldrovandia affinis]